MVRRSTSRAIWLVAALVLRGAPAIAQAPPPAGAVTLADGVRQSLEHARLVTLAQAEVDLQQAAVRQTRGTFDGVLQLQPMYEHRENDIRNTGFFNQERVKRGFAQGLATGFGQVADLLDEQIKNDIGDLPLCPSPASGGYSTYLVTLPGSALPVPLCRPAADALNNPSFDPLTTGALGTTAPSRPALGTDPLSAFQLQQMLSTVFRAQISTASLNAREAGRETLQTLAAAARLVEVEAGLVFERLGPIPDFVYSNTASLTADYTKPLRNGSAFQFTATFNGAATIFREKPIDPTFGGASVPNAFTNRLEAAWMQPLLRGRGRVEAQAPELAAMKSADASRYNFQQTSADQTLTTADAYFDLMAARDMLALNSDSLNTQRQLLDTTIRLVAAGEVPSADLDRIRARTSEMESNVQGSRLAVISAQTELADAMGLPAAAVATLEASDVFPVKPLDVDVDELSKDAVSKRADVKAQSAFRDTSRILLEAAKADMRHRLDVRLSGGYGQIYDGPFFHSLPDEATPPTNADFVKYYDPTGFWRAFKGRWEPIGGVTCTFELPFGNSQRKGQYEQAIASNNQSEIRLADLGRTIVNNMPKLAETLRRARTEWAQRQDAVVQYESTWDTAQRLRGAGEMSLIDTLLTEQQLTDARLALVEAKREYASAVAHVRREAGVLVDFSGTTTANAQVNLAGVVDAR
jgi:outer membrane protein TolC